MFDIIRNDITQADQLDEILDLQAFAEEHRHAILNAAAWLGGQGGSRHALEALDSIYAPEVSPRRALRLFDEVHALLMLEHVHDPEREEAEIFAGIDPSDPRVEDVCLLADGLAARLEACHVAVARQNAYDSRRAAA